MGCGCGRNKVAVTSAQTPEQVQAQLNLPPVLTEKTSVENAVKNSQGDGR